MVFVYRWMKPTIALFLVEYPGPKSGKNGTITLKVYLRGFDEVRSGYPSVAMYVY